MDKLIIKLQFLFPLHISTAITFSCEEFQHFRQSKTSEERKKSNSNVRSTSINSSAPSRPQSRNSKVILKRQNSLDVSTPSPRQTNAEGNYMIKMKSLHNKNILLLGQNTVTEKIRMMLSTPKQSKKLEQKDTHVETEENIEATGISVAVKDTIDTMFQQIKQTTDIEDEIKLSKHPQVENEDLTSLTDSTKTDNTSRSVRSVKRVSSVTAKQKLEMLKHLPTARKDEYKTYTSQPNKAAANNKHKKSNVKLVNLNVKETKRGDS